MIGHIIERAVIHIFMDLGLVVAVFAVIESFRSRIPQLPSLQS